MVLLFINSELNLPSFNLVLNARFCYTHLGDVLILPLADAVGPLRVTSVELAQELVLGRLEGLLGA